MFLSFSFSKLAALGNTYCYWDRVAKYAYFVWLPEAWNVFYNAAYLAA